MGLKQAVMESSSLMSIAELRLLRGGLGTFFALVEIPGREEYVIALLLCC